MAMNCYACKVYASWPGKRKHLIGATRYSTFAYYLGSQSSRMVKGRAWVEVPTIGGGVQVTHYEEGNRVEK